MDQIRNAAMGGLSYIKIKYKFGRTLVLASTVTNAEITELGGAYTGFNAVAAETISLVSSSASDTAVYITIEGLDANYNEISETVLLTGQTPKLTTLKFLRAARGYVAGATALVGNVTYKQSTTTANVFGIIYAVYGQTNIACFTVPEGYNCLIFGIEIGMARTGGAAGSASVTLQRRNTGKAWRSFRTDAITTSKGVSKEYAGGLVFPERCDIRARIIDISDNTTYFTCEIEYALFKND